MKKIITAIISVALSAIPVIADRYVGGDISLLLEYEAAGAQYKTHDGTPIADLLPWCREQGMNAMRVRLFVNPSKYTGDDKDSNACQTLEYITPLCQRIVDNGLALMLDFHYSDTWADPAKQYTPADWAGLTDDQLYQKIYDYTRQTLISLKEAGVTPAFIQPGNEISYGMLWGPVGTPDSQLKKTLMGSAANWERLGKLLNQAIKACREVCPEAKIILHTERVTQVDVQSNFYDEMKRMDVDYDIIGLSYYPYWHGDLSVLNTALTSLEGRYPEKEIMIVETGYPYKWEVPGSDHDVTDQYPYSDEGQDKFARELVQTLEAHSHVDGLFWWWMEYNAYNTDLAGWYNAPLFDSTTGRATAALKTICSFATNTGISSLPDDGVTDHTDYFDLTGKRIAKPGHGIYILKNGTKTEKLIK